jgi:hypothetical protein
VLIKLFGLYLQHFNVFDAAILILGFTVLVVQVKAFASSKALNTTRGPIYDNQLKQLTSAIRYGTLAVDGLPLLGLLGTVGALLVTFAGMGDETASAAMIANFAPGLTSTVSGLIFAIANLLALNLGLIPAYQRIRGSSNG